MTSRSRCPESCSVKEMLLEDVLGPAISLKKDSGAGVFLWNLWNF